MALVSIAVILSLLLAVGMVVLFEFGRRLAVRRTKDDVNQSQVGSGVVDGAIFGLLGLLIAFTFSGAASRFDRRRELIVEESNNIGTAWLRLDVLAPEHRDALRDLMRQYLDTRLAFYDQIDDPTKAQANFDRSNDLQKQIWDRAVIACNEVKDNRATVVLLPALNSMFDIASTRVLTMKLHPPLVIFAMLYVLILVSALLAGYGMAVKTRMWLHATCFALIMAASFYLIVDLEYPRLGLIRIDAFDKVLVDLRKSMG